MRTAQLPSFRWFVVGFALSGLSAWAQPQDPGATARKQLGDYGSGRRSVAPQEAADLLAHGLQDASTRQNALLAIVGRGALARAGKTPQAVGVWVSERTALESVRPAVDAALSDPEDFTRHAAVQALGMLAADPTKFPDIEIDARAWKVLGDAYRREPAALVRGEVMKTAALTSGAVETRRAILTAGLADADGGVISQAVRGLARIGDLGALPRLAELLTHDNRNVRLASALGLVGYGKVAQKYIPALESAAAAEADEVVKKSMLGAVSGLRDAK